MINDPIPPKQKTTYMCIYVHIITFHLTKKYVSTFWRVLVGISGICKFKTCEGKTPLSQAPSRLGSKPVQVASTLSHFCRARSALKLPRDLQVWIQAFWKKMNMIFLRKNTIYQKEGINTQHHSQTEKNVSSIYTIYLLQTGICLTKN